MKFAQVLLPMPFNEAFDYKVPDGMHLQKGDFVEVPLGAQRRVGVVWGFEAPKTESEKIKPLNRKLEIAPLSKELMSFIEWVARYHVTYIGNILAQVLRPSEILIDGPYRNEIIIGDNSFDRVTAPRERLLEFVKSQPKNLTRQEISVQSGVSVAVISQAIKSGVLKEIKKEIDGPYENPKTQFHSELNEAQSAAVDAALIETRPCLLDGITGSGKTEVYLETISRLIESDETAQILILLPEIALTQAIIARIETHFGARPIEWHNEVSIAAKRRAWRQINKGNARIVIGARSAIFLPFQNLRLIVVDEEHDTSYKQEDGLRYNARDLAVVRAKFSGAKVMLASATPSLESRNNAKTQKYRHLFLRTRFGQASLPNIELVNLKEFPPPKEKWLSPLLIEGIADSLSRKEQALLFLNRRGFAPHVLCTRCGHRMMSPNSDSWLVEHRFSGQLVCHLTGYSIKKPVNCPACNGFDTLASIGPGVERIALEVKELFPKANIEILSSDTALNPNNLREIVARMERSEIDILIGTQIVAKGHNFPNLTFVGIVDGDLSLKGGDPRAGERTYQLLTQVAGRAGRTGLKSRALIQTYYPDSEAFQALLNNDRDGFLNIETEMRAMTGLPPFGRLASLQLMAKSDEILEKAKDIVNAALINAEGVEVFGPAAPPIALVRGWRRTRYLIKAEKNVDISAFVLAWRKRIKLPATVRLIIDIEPYSFM